MAARGTSAGDVTTVKIPRPKRRRPYGAGGRYKHGRTGVRRAGIAKGGRL